MRRVLLPIILALFFAGCGEDESTEVKVNNTVGQDAGAFIVFDSTGGDIPYPNNILFAATTLEDIDGTLNIPYEESDADASVKSALNTLTGFSTTSPITVGFNGSIDSASLITGVKVFEITAEASPATGGVPIITGLTAPLAYGTDYVTTISGNKIAIIPIKTLKSNQNYMVVLTDSIVDENNRSIAPDLASNLLLQTEALIDETGNHTTLSTEDATTFEGIRQATQGLIYAADQAGVDRDTIVSAWSFKTQTIGDNFTDVKAENISGALQVGNSTLTTADIGAYGKADIWVGVMANLPYYLGTPSVENPVAPLNSYYVDAEGSPIFTGMPALQDTKTVPVLMTKPNANSAAVIGGAEAPWPVVIFQHGITQNRTNVLAIADALADAGYATVAMDLPLHGLDNNATGLMTSYERTFNMDYVGQDEEGSIISEGPDGIIDSSGRHYINLASLLTSRDNIRQSASDLLALKNALGAAGVGIDDLDSTRIAFVGHSLGTISSFGFLSHTSMESTTLAMPGGGIAELLNNSPAFGSEIEAGLAAKGVIKGTSAYSSFMLATQTILDDADPINYTTAVATTQVGKIFAIEVVGNGEEGTSDQVIPNSVATAPLSGTEPLVQYLGTENLTVSSVIGTGKTARFLEGDHSSILDPTSSLDATVEMQTQVATFVSSTGTDISVTDEALLYNPAP